ncbi:MAG: leucine-rich repeat protein [Merdimonas faecis]|uniref:leucine-rich repeat protein n=1 Tax=Merdimonas faecis TaxID=1653435 RepID=UPI0039908FA5
MRKNVLAWALVLALGITNTLTVMGAEAEENVSVQEGITEEELEQAPEEETEEKDEAQKGAEETVTGDDIENKEDENGEKTSEEDKAEEGADEEKQEEIESAEKQQNENLEIGTVVKTGSCGEHLTYTITVNGKDEEGNDTYTLEIEGYGDMIDYDDFYTHNNGDSPWASEREYQKLMTKVIMPEGLTSIGDWAFFGCSGLTGDLKIPDSVRIIGESAFSNCKGLNGQLYLPTGLRQIGEQAFYLCSGLTGDLKIPNSVTSIGIWAFGECSGFNGQLHLPNKLREIRKYAFAECSGLEGDLKIPNSVTTINTGAFRNCKNLKSIKFYGKAPYYFGYDIFESIPKLTAYYPANDSTWTSDKLQDYGSDITWKRWFPDENKTTVSIAGKEEHYLSASDRYETGSGKTETIAGDKVIKNTTWNVAGTATMEDGTLYIRSDAVVTVSGTLNARDIFIEKGGKLVLKDGGKIDARSVTANGGWIGDSGGRLEVAGGLLVADELNFEGRSTLAVTSGGKIAAGEMTVATGSRNSSLDNGTIFISTKLKLVGNKSNFVSESGNFSVVFYGNADVSLEASGSKFCLGKLYVEEEDVFQSLELESGNYISASTCTVNTSKWTFTTGKNLSSATESAKWSENVESAFRGLVAQSAFQSNSSQLTAEENQFVNALASVWINTLNTPLCEGFVESSAIQQELKFEINGKECILKSKGIAFGFGGVNAVYLNVDGASYDSTVGIVSNANVKEFSEKAKKYLAENMKSEFIGYASGGIAGALQGAFGWGDITTSVVEKFIEKTVKNVCIDSSVLNTSNSKSVQDLKKSFKVLDMLSGSAKTMSVKAAENSASSTKVPEEEQEEIIISDLSPTVKDDWLRQEFIAILGDDGSGEPDFSKAAEITSLDLSNGYIRDLSGIQYFKNLEELNIANNEISDLSPLSGCAKLKTLDASGQYISNLGALSALKELTKLNLADNELTTLSSLKELAGLQKLDVSGNEIAVFGTAGKLQNLQYLNMADNPMGEIDLSTLSGLANLTELNVSGCGIESIEGINTGNLTTLNVSYNQIDSAAALEKAEKLRTLDISYNMLTEADGLKSCIRMQELSMEGNPLENIAWIEPLTELTNINLAQTGLVEEDLVYFQNMKNLQTLDLSGDMIFGVSAIMDLGSLQQITISYTPLNDTDIQKLEEKNIEVINETVYPAVQRLYFIEEQAEISVGETYWQDPVCYPSGSVLEDAVWTSSDETVAVVDQSGVVTAQKGGSVEIKVTTAGGELEAVYQMNIADGAKGDINGDGNINLVDLMQCLNHVGRKELLEGEALEAADINEDDVVNLVDLMRLLNYVGRKSETL